MSNTPKLDIVFLDSHDLQTIVVGDTSVYPSNFVIQYPTLEVTPPGFVKVPISISSRNITVLNSLDTGITKEDQDLVSLPDGIWEFRYSVSPNHIYNVKKRFLRTDNLQAALGNAFIKVDIGECDDDIKVKDKEALHEIEHLIQEAIALANACIEAKAMDVYRLAAKKLTNFLKCK